MKKAKAGIQEKGIIKTFERRGVIIAKSNFEITLDSAEEDAIECGAEEVNFYLSTIIGIFMTSNFKSSIATLGLTHRVTNVFLFRL